jgi:hypothetical protein
MGGGLGPASSGSYSLEHRKCFATEYENKCFLSDRFWYSLSLFPSVLFLPNEYIPWQPNNDSVAMTMGTNKKCQSNTGKQVFKKKGTGSLYSYLQEFGQM